MYNYLFIDLLDIITDWFRDMYSVFGTDFVLLNKLAWDASIGFSASTTTLLVQEFMDEEEMLADTASGWKHTNVAALVSRGRPHKELFFWEEADSNR